MELRFLNDKEYKPFDDLTEDKKILLKTAIDGKFITGVTVMSDYHDDHELCALILISTAGWELHFDAYIVGWEGLASLSYFGDCDRAKEETYSLLQMEFDMGAEEQKDLALPKPLPFSVRKTGGLREGEWFYNTLAEAEERFDEEIESAITMELRDNRTEMKVKKVLKRYKENKISIPDIMAYAEASGDGS